MKIRPLSLVGTLVAFLATHGVLAANGGSPAADAPAAVDQATDSSTPSGPNPTPRTPPKREEKPEEKLEEVVVTGSLITNPALTKSSPVLDIGHEEIELRQTNVAEELLREVPGAVAATNSEVTNSTYGASTVNLRGLGENRNLVLLDGARVTPWGLDGSVDLNDIPLSIIDHVEVLTGGASSTYGADAVAGVVNFITKKNFSGVEFNASDQINKRGDNNTLRTDITLGGKFDDGRGNALVSFGYQQSNGLFRTQRPYAEPSIDSYTGRPIYGSSATVPGSFTLGQSILQLNPATGSLGAPYSPFNSGQYSTMQEPFKRINLFGQGNYKVNDSVEVYGQMMFSKYTVQDPFAPTDTSGTLVNIPYSNPFLPVAARNQFCGVNGLSAAQCAAAAAATDPSDPNFQTFSTEVYRKIVEAGKTGITFDTNMYQARLGVRGTINDHVKFDVYGTYGEGENVQTLTANALYSSLQQGLMATNPATCLDPSNGCVPLNLFGPAGSISQAAAAFLTGGPTYLTTRTILGTGHAAINGDLGLSSPEARTPIGYAVGAEYRRYVVDTLPDQTTSTPGQLLDEGAIPAFEGSYDVKEEFVELIAPLLEDKTFAKNLDIELGARESDYSTAGHNFTWKAGGNWEPIAGVKFRGNYQVAARAPNINELFSPVQRGYASISSDPCAGPNVTPNSNLGKICIAQGAPAAALGSIFTPDEVNSVIGGNRNLGVETAKTYTFGIVYLPEELRPLSVAIDYYHIHINNAISQAAVDDVINECFSPSYNPGLNVTSACTAIRRNPVTGLLNGDQNTTPGIPLLYSNLGQLGTDGIDLSINDRAALPLGALTLGFDANWTHSSTFQSDPNTINRQCAGYYSSNCESIQPKWSWTQRTTYSLGAFDVSLLWRFIGSEKYEPQALIDDGGPADGPLAQYQHIPAFNYFDLTGRWSVTQNLQVTLLVANLFDKQPPMVGSTIGYYNYNMGNTYPATYDVEGRRFGLNVNWKL